MVFEGHLENAPGLPGNKEIKLNALLMNGDKAKPISV
jgi:hypothetical protein